ncbi:MAG: hypothetical protein HON53_12815 [Planctomycetaceae bacterium]|nr:hypothetical protein [Planctomycetaceae bacterium]MBT6155377.1 hypothetical protein [Planctomycetaceae bacterium]MBT6487295.1 hypothetical protein [Planctomycetaceae bacterium]MBT6493692.1 hypothetical protein [Planctomycetaceae bacterium]
MPAVKQQAAARCTHVIDRTVRETTFSLAQPVTGREEQTDVFTPSRPTSRHSVPILPAKTANRLNTTWNDGAAGRLTGDNDPYGIG